MGADQAPTKVTRTLAVPSDGISTSTIAPADPFGSLPRQTIHQLNRKTFPNNRDYFKPLTYHLRFGRMLEAEMSKSLTEELSRHEAHLMHQLKADSVELDATGGGPVPIASLPDAD